MKSEELFDDLMSSIIFTPDKEFVEKVNKKTKKLKRIFLCTQNQKGNLLTNVTSVHPSGRMKTKHGTGLSIWR